VDASRVTVYAAAAVLSIVSGALPFGTCGGTLKRHPHGETDAMAANEGFDEILRQAK